MSTGRQYSEDEVVEGCRQGADWARAELFDRHHRPLYRFLVAHCGDPALAEDLVQETFIKVYAKIGRFRGDAKVSTWMTRIALNCFYEIVRRSRTHQRTLDSIAKAGDSSHQAAWHLPRSQDTVSRRELGDLLAKALHRVSEADRAIILLHDLRGFRYQEIADILDIAMGTVASRLSRARNRLREAVRQLSSPSTPTEENGPQSRRTDELNTSSMSSRRTTARLGAPGATKPMIWSKQ